MPIWRNFRDPTLISRASRYEDLRKSYWEPSDYATMNDRFVGAMERAGYSVTAPSMSPCTRYPVSGYRRDDAAVLP
jgi:hypothetical protein